jgi:hypothetical protein
MSKTQSEMNEYFFDMGKYWTDTNQSKKIQDCRDRYNGKPYYKNRLIFLEKGIKASGVVNNGS